MEPLSTVTTLLASKVLRDAITRAVFEAVAKPRTILVRDLRNNLAHELKSGGGTGFGHSVAREIVEGRTNLSEEDLEHSITVLKDADLIKERPAAISDFSTLYLTANGLSAANVLNDSSLMAKLGAEI